LRKSTRKLLLHRETLHQLSPDARELRGVAGGAISNLCSDLCSNTACKFTCLKCSYPEMCTQ
jgi:hypothetical protein